VLTEPQAQKALGGDRYVASLREAIDASLAALSDPSASEALAARISFTETPSSPNT
jgi:hypothetical protein